MYGVYVGVFKQSLTLRFKQNLALFIGKFFFTLIMFKNIVNKVFLEVILTMLFWLKKTLKIKLQNQTCVYFLHWNLWILIQDFFLCWFGNIFWPWWPWPNIFKHETQFFNNGFNLWFQNKLKAYRWISRRLSTMTGALPAICFSKLEKALLAEDSLIGQP